MNSILKVFLLLILFSASYFASSQCQDLFFSEYIEGSASNRALEIYNPTNMAIDLTDYVIYRYNNGSISATDSLFPQGSLAPFDVFVVTNPGTALTFLITQSDTAHSTCFFNGDDAISLKKISSGVTLDIIGDIGVDPGSGWSVGSGATNNFTLIRQIFINEGQTNWNIGSTEWDIFPIDMDDSLGAHSMTRCLEITTNIDSNVSCNGWADGGASVTANYGVSPYTYLWSNGDTLSYADSLSPGTYTVKVTDFSGNAIIGSVVITEPAVLTGSISDTACKNYTWLQNGVTYYTSGSYIDTILNANGCDSIVTLNLIVYPSNDVTVIIDACDSLVVNLGQSGTYTFYQDLDTLWETYTDVNGCDSNIYWDINISNSHLITETFVECDSFTWSNGVTYYQSNTTAVQTFVNQGNCDSIIALNLDIININDTIVFSNNTLKSLQSNAAYQWLNCDNNYAIIPGENNQDFSFSANGNYAVEVTYNGCIDTSNCLVVSGIGLNEITNQNSKIKLYPNPVYHQLSLSFGETYDDIGIAIYALSGQLVKTYNYSKKENISLEVNFEPGQYVLEVSLNGIIASRHQLVKY